MSKKAIQKHAAQASAKKGGFAGFLSENRFVLLAFAIPFILMTAAFALQGASPFGDKQILVTDLWHQYYPFLVDLQEKLTHGGSLLYDWSVGGGVNFLALMSYYTAGPINLLSVLVPPEFLREFLMFSVAARIACASMFFAMFLRYTFKVNNFSLTIFGTMFAFCAFFMGYYWNVIWLDSVALTPLVIMGMVALLREGKFKLYIISLAVSIVANYYIGLFLCIFTLLCFIGYAVCKWNGTRDFMVKLGRMGVYTIISLCLTAIMTIPAFLGLQNTYSTVNKWPSTYDINIGATDDLAGTLQAFAKILSNMIAFIEPATKDSTALPNIYCGVFAIILGIVFLTSNKIKLKEKLFNTGLLIFITLSFIIRQLDYIWHGMHFTNMIPYRFSFLFSFVLLAMAFRAYTVIDKVTVWDSLIAALFTAIIILIGIQEQTPLALISTAIIAFLIVITLVLFAKKILPKKATSIILCTIVIAEAACSGYIGVQTVTLTTTNDYPRGGEKTANVISHMKEEEKDTVDLWRAEMTNTQTLNDGALNGYRGLSMFSSMANVSITRFVEDFGLAGWTNGNRYTYSDGSPLTNLFFNLKYLISRDGKHRNTDYFTEVYNEGNVKLLKNNAYLPMGFMTNSELASYTVPVALRNPFESQSEFFKLATGIDEELFTPMQVVSQGHTEYEKFNVNKNGYGDYTMISKDAGQTPHLKFNYTAERDGLYFAYLSASPATSMRVKKNDVDVFTYDIGRPYIMCLGRFEKGDKISLYTDVNKITANAQYKVNVYCNVLNEDVFNKAYEQLSQSTLSATKVTDTSIEGTINVKNDGLFYTSIPYEKGWSAKVDGKPVEITPVGNALVAFELSKGEHKIELNYVPDGFVLGVCIVLFGVAALVFMSFFAVKIRKKLKLEEAPEEDESSQDELS